VLATSGSLRRLCRLAIGYNAGLDHDGAVCEQHQQGASAPNLSGGVAFAAVDATAKLERILGPKWETMTSRQVEERPRELERVSNFAWSLVRRMYEQHASNAGAVLQPNDHQPAE
jgi:hypothetical protein